MGGRYWCHFCNTFLTKDSLQGRKQHAKGNKHQSLVRLYWVNFLKHHAQVGSRGNMVFAEKNPDQFAKEEEIELNHTRVHSKPPRKLTNHTLKPGEVYTGNDWSDPVHRIPPVRTGHVYEPPSIWGEKATEETSADPSIVRGMAPPPPPPNLMDIPPPPPPGMAMGGRQAIGNNNFNNHNNTFSHNFGNKDNFNNARPGGDGMRHNHQGQSFHGNTTHFHNQNNRHNNYGNTGNYNNNRYGNNGGSDYNQVSRSNRYGDRAHSNAPNNTNQFNQSNNFNNQKGNNYGNNGTGFNNNNTGYPPRPIGMGMAMGNNNNNNNNNTNMGLNSNMKNMAFTGAVPPPPGDMMAMMGNMMVPPPPPQGMVMPAFIPQHLRNRMNKQ